MDTKQPKLYLQHDTCKNVAFYLLKMPKSLEKVGGKNIIWQGKQAPDTGIMRCQTCNEIVFIDNLVMDKIKKLPPV